MKVSKLLIVFIFFIWLSVSSFAVPLSWTVIPNPTNFATIAFSPFGSYTVNGRALTADDAIGVFYTVAGQAVCGGYVTWNGTASIIVVSGNNADTPFKDGFDNNEAYSFRLWENTLQVEIANPTVNFFYGRTTFLANATSIYNGFSGTTANNILAPTLIAPENLATNAATNQTLSWATVSNANRYQVQITTLNNFTTPDVDTVVIGALSLVSPALSNSTNYFWRVRGATATRQGDWSDIRTFTTIAPAQSTLPTSWAFTANTTNSSNITFSPVGTYSINGRVMADGDAVGVFYTRNNQLVCAGNLIWTGNTFSLVAWGDNPLTTTKDGMNLNEAYTFKLWDHLLQMEISNPTFDLLYGNAFYTVNGVTAYNGFSGQAIAVFPAPTLVAPNNLATGMQLNPILTWNSVANATSYKVQVSTSNTFATTLVDAVLTDTTKLVMGLDYSTPYFWRVQASNSTLTSEWSSLRMFATELAPPSYTVSGTLNYANASNKIMNHCIIIFKDANSVEQGRDTTDSNGNYSVSGLTDGNYKITITTVKPAGGYNSIDIYLIRQKLAGLISFSSIQQKAADINNNSSLSSLDVLPLRQKIANLVCPNWLIPNYVYYPNSCTISGADVTLNIRSLCGGDVNGSFIPNNN